MDGKRAFSVVGERYGNLRSDEVSILENLLDDFGITPLSVSEIQQKIQLRYQLLDDLNFGTDRNADDWLKFVILIHQFLYNNLMSFAGSFRRDTDKGGSGVHFGGIDPRTGRDKFSGMPPKQIESALVEAFQTLLDAKNPVEASIRFYATWSWIHPFYDANGRIGRVLVQTYLKNALLCVNWARIDQKHTQFMNKLNECHTLREGNSNIFEKRFVHLKHFWAKFIESLPIESPDV